MVTFLLWAVWIVGMAFMAVTVVIIVLGVVVNGIAFCKENSIRGPYVRHKIRLLPIREWRFEQGERFDETLNLCEASVIPGHREFVFILRSTIGHGEFLEAVYRPFNKTLEATERVPSDLSDRPFLVIIDHKVNYGLTSGNAALKLMYHRRVHRFGCIEIASGPCIVFEPKG